MILTQANYHSTEASKKYMGVSQFKEFQKCEARALARVNGEYQEEKTVPLLIGSYVDSYFSGTLDKFMEENIEIFNVTTKENEFTVQKLIEVGGGYVTRNNTLVANKISEAKTLYPDFFTVEKRLKADYVHANYIIERIERDNFFMQCMSGEKQVVKTGEIEGVPVKIMIDSYHPNIAIVDLKIMASMDAVWKKDIQGKSIKLNFVEAWGYDIQGAVYQEIEGNKLQFMLAVATKEKPEPDINVFTIDQERLDFCLGIVKQDIKRYHSIKLGEIEPTRCGECDYCRRTKVLVGAVNYRELD